MARSFGGRSGQGGKPRRRMGRRTGCLVWILALLLFLLLLSVLFGGFQRGTKAGGARPADPKELAMPSARSSEAGGVTARLRAALATALASRDRSAASAIRSALAAIGNAGAVGVPADYRRSATTSAHFAGASPGAGSAEVPRRALSEADIAHIVRTEITDRQAAARHYDELGRADQATRLRREADVLAATLGSPGEGS